jgi:hypothetical protein
MDVRRDANDPAKIASPSARVRNRNRCFRWKPPNATYLQLWRDGHKTLFVTLPQHRQHEIVEVHIVTFKA